MIFVEDEVLASLDAAEDDEAVLGAAEWLVEECKRRLEEPCDLSMRRRGAAERLADMVNCRCNSVGRL